MLAYFQDLEETKLLSIVRELYFNHPSEKILVLAPSFRQALRLSKILSWQDSSLEVKRDLDIVKLDNGRIIFMGIEDGSKPRGLRYNNLFIYNARAMPIEAIQMVVLGFQTTAEEPISLIKEKALEKKQKEKDERTGSGGDSE